MRTLLNTETDLPALTRLSRRAVYDPLLILLDSSRDRLQVVLSGSIPTQNPVCGSTGLEPSELCLPELELCSVVPASHVLALGIRQRVEVDAFGLEFDLGDLFVEVVGHVVDAGVVGVAVLE